MKNFCTEFCWALKELRNATGKGQIAFAKELGLSQPVYARYEKGDREPTLNELIRIARALGVTPNVLLGFEPPPKGGINAGDNAQVANVIGNGNSVNFAPTPRKRKSKE